MIAGAKLLPDQRLNILLDVLGANRFQFFYFLLPFELGKKQKGAVVVSFDRPGGEPAKLAFQFEFFQCVFCQQKNHPFTVSAKRWFCRSVVQSLNKSIVHNWSKTNYQNLLKSSENSEKQLEISVL